MDNKVLACDGCGELMDLKYYQEHDCPAYKDSEYRNPLDHKLKVAVWKVPSGTLRANGNVIG